MNAPSNPNTALIDQHLMTVGKLISNAATCDAVLFSTFKVISGCELKVASAIYFSSEALSAKKYIITRVLHANGDHIETKIVERIIKSAEIAQNQRNELSHALLSVSVDGQEVLSHNPRRQSQAKKPVTPAFLGSLLKRSGEAFLAAHTAFQELCQRRGIPPTVNLE